MRCQIVWKINLKIGNIYDEYTRTKIMKDTTDLRAEIVKDREIPEIYPTLSQLILLVGVVERAEET